MAQNEYGWGMDQDDPWGQPQEDQNYQGWVDPNQQNQQQQTWADPNAQGSQQDPNQQPDQQQVDMSGWDTDGYGNPVNTMQASGGPMVGWEADNWNDANMQTPKYVAGRMWSNFDAGNQDSVRQAAEAFMSAYPGQYRYDGKDRLINLSDGSEVDFVAGYGGEGARFNWGADYGGPQHIAPDGNTTAGAMDPNANLADANGGAIDPGPGYTGATSEDPFAAIGGGVFVNGGWVPKGHPAAQAAQASTSTGQTGSTSNTTSTGHSVSINGQPTDVNSELWTMLMGRAKQGLEVGRDNANVRGQADAYSAQEERARRMGLTDAAESSSPYNTGYSSGLQRLSAAQMGQRVGAMEAQLIGKEIQARRDEIQNALTEMGDLLTDQQKMSLEMKLNELDNATQRYGIDQSTALGRERLNSDDAQWRAQLAQRGQEWSGDNAYRYDKMGMENNQFLDDLGFKTADRQSYWDWIRRGNKI